MKVLLYRGKSIVSRLIRFQTRSIYSHAAIQLDDGSVIEAWHKGGVRRLSRPKEGHSKGTPIDVYAITGKYDSGTLKVLLVQEIGKKYDFGAVARFLSRRKEQADDKWFCSELVVDKLAKAGLVLLNGNPSEMSPRDVSLSPYLKYEKTL